MVRLQHEIEVFAYAYLICIIAFSSISESAGYFQTIALGATKVVFAILLFLYVTKLLIIKEIKLDRSILVLSIFGLYCVFSSITGNVDSNISSIIFSILTCYIYSQCFSKEEDIEKFFKTCIFGGYLLLFLLIVKSGSILALVNAIRSDFLTDVLIQKNILAYIMAVITVICFFFSNVMKRKVYYYIMILPVLMLLATGSRRALISLILGIVILSILEGNGIKKIKNLMLASIVIIIIRELLDVAFFSSMNQRLSTLIQGLVGNTGFSASDESRFSMIKLGLDMFFEKPLLGHGAGAFKETSGFGKYSHNNYIELLVNFGMVGFCLYYYVIISKLKTALRGIYFGKTIEKLFLTLLIVRLFSDFGNVSYYDKFSLAILGIIMYYYNITGKRIKQRY